MKVKELIEVLKEHDGEMEVCVRDYEGCPTYIGGLAFETVRELQPITPGYREFVDRRVLVIQD